MAAYGDRFPAINLRTAPKRTTIADPYLALSPCRDPTVVISEKVISHFDFGIRLFSLETKRTQCMKILPYLNSTVICCLPEDIVKRKEKGLPSILKDMERTSPNHLPDGFCKVHNLISDRL